MGVRLEVFNPTGAIETTHLHAPRLDTFAGKTVSIIVPTAAGSSTDIVTRLYARFLPQHLPGRPNMIVRNMPGGAYTVGGNYGYNSKPDGLTLLATTSGLHMAQLLGVSAVRFDLVKMTALLGQSAGGVYLARSGIINKVEDLPGASRLVYGYSAGTSVGNVILLIAKESLPIAVDKIVLAYSSAGEAFRAFVAGEVNFTYSTGPEYYSSIAPFTDKGEVMLLFQSGILDDNGKLVRDPGIPPAPTFGELYEKVNGKPLSATPWDAYRAGVAAGYNVNKSMFLPPGTPDGIIRAYWDACAAMLKDTGFRAQIDPLVGAGAKWGVGDAYDKMFKTNFAVKPEIRDWLIKTLTRYGVVIE